MTTKIYHSLKDVQDATEKEIYNKGLIDGLMLFAWWKDGVQYVGTAGTTLKEAIEKHIKK